MTMNRNRTLAVMTERIISGRHVERGTGEGDAYPDRERAHTSFPP
jgi:hypothetical protein